jgi:hypothetical protein
VRAFFEPRFGHDFGDVRIHTGAAATRAADAIHARAFTLGRDIAFGHGEYAPGTSAGRRLMAHELAHVVQQQQAGFTPAAHASAGGSEPGCIQRQGKPQSYDELLAEEHALQEKERKEQQEKQEREQKRKAEEIATIERASARGRGLMASNAPPFELTIAGASVAYRLMSQYFPFLADSVAGIGFRSDAGNVRITPSEPSRGLDQDSSFTIELGPDFMKATMARQKEMLETALRGLPSTGTAPGVSDLFKEAAAVVAKVEFGSMTGSVGGQVDPADAYDASAWQEISKKVIRAKIEPWRAMKRLVDKADRPVPTADGQMRRWRFDCFDAVVFARMYARWRTMSRFNFNAFFFPLELGFDSRFAGGAGTEWQSAIMSPGPGASRFIEGKAEIRINQSGDALERIPVKESWDKLLEEAPIGTQIIWSNKDAQTRCLQAQVAREKGGTAPDPSYCESFQNENTTKLGPDTYLAHPFNVVNRETIETELANAVRDTQDRPMPLAAYKKKFIYISSMRRPK